MKGEAVSTTNHQNPIRYTRTAMVLHWVVAVMIIGNVVLGLAADSLPDDWIRSAVDTHKSIGLTVLGLALLRLLWRFANPPPAMPDSYSPLERLGAHAAHWALYALIFAMPITGWIHDSAWEGAPTHPFLLWGVVPHIRIGAIEALDAATKQQIHSTFFAFHVWFAYALYTLLALHIVGALKHQFWDGERELQRMLS
jgi:cytochrome b561